LSGYTHQEREGAGPRIQRATHGRAHLLVLFGRFPWVKIRIPFEINAGLTHLVLCGWHVTICGQMAHHPNWV